MTTKADRFEIHPETTLLISKCRAVGGRHTETEEIRDERFDEAREVESKVTTRVDNVEERELAEKIASKGRHLIAKASVNTLIGMLAPASKLAEILAGLEEVRAMADHFNSTSETCKVEIGVLPIAIAIAMGPESARALADHVREELQALHDALRAGDAKKARAILLPTRAGNLAQLAVGMQAEAIQFAIEEGADRLATLKGKTKSVSGLAETPESVGRGLDLTMIESAIGCFTYAGQASTLALVGA